MTMESNYAGTIAKLGDWLKNLAPFFLTSQKLNQNQSYLVRMIFPALWAGCR